MNKQSESTAVLNLLTDYANALNAANTALIPSFYTEEGQLMPDGLKNLTKKDLLRNSQKFFKQISFQIAYAAPDTIIDGNYAFVQTTAKTTTKNLRVNKIEDQTTRDFFVLRKENEDWKILRYIFNKFKED